MIVVDGIILPQLERYVNRKLDQSQKLGADLVILEINSPGGELDATLNLADRLRKLSWAHTVAYVPEEALSGAAILALACDEIVMGPRARLGDAGPIFQGPDALFRHAPEKIRSDLALRVRDLATAKGRPPALAEAMVDANLPVYRVVHKESGQTTFMSAARNRCVREARPLGERPAGAGIAPGSFLEVNGLARWSCSWRQRRSTIRDSSRERYAGQRAAAEVGTRCRGCGRGCAQHVLGDGRCCL